MNRTISRPPKLFPTMVYHRDFPERRIETPEALQKALADGWSQNPVQADKDLQASKQPKKKT